MNAVYRRCHGFPFIVAVCNHTTASILVELQRRAGLDTDAELAEALDQVSIITGGRVRAAVRDD